MPGNLCYDDDDNLVVFSGARASYGQPIILTHGVKPFSIFDWKVAFDLCSVTAGGSGANKRAALRVALLLTLMRAIPVHKRNWQTS